MSSCINCLWLADRKKHCHYKREKIKGISIENRNEMQRVVGVLLFSSAACVASIPRSDARAFSLIYTNQWCLYVSVCGDSQLNYTCAARLCFCVRARWQWAGRRSVCVCVCALQQANKSAHMRFICRLQFQNWELSHNWCARELHLGVRFTPRCCIRSILLIWSRRQRFTHWACIIHVLAYYCKFYGGYENCANSFGTPCCRM